MDAICQLDIYFGISYILPKFCSFCIGYLLKSIGGYKSAGHKYWYWIYSANNQGICKSWRVSVHPLGAKWGNVLFEIYIFVLVIHSQQFGDYCQLDVYILVLVILCQQFGDMCKLEGVWEQRGGKHISLYLCKCISSSSCLITQKIISNTVEQRAFQKYSM